MTRFVLLAFIMHFFVGYAYCQQNVLVDFDKFYSGEDGFKEAKKLIKDGDVHFVENIKTSYHNALEDYLKAYSYNSNYAPLNYKIGVCYLKLLYKSLSLPYLEKAYKLDPNVAIDISYQLGKAYQYNCQFEKAIHFFELYKRSLAGTDAKADIKKADIAMKECSNGMELIKHPVNCYIENMGNHINSHFSDYGPIISADETSMFFTARRPDTYGAGTDPDDNQYYEDIYESHRTSDGWSVAVNAGSKLNSKVHDATVSLSPDGQHIILFRSEDEGDLYESTLHGDNWSEPKRLPSSINSPEKESSAAYSSDGNTLYFTSYRKDLSSFGGSDIFVCKRNADGEWGEARNLGAIVNSEADEVGVYLMPDDKTLYFSSNNARSMGGFDIFKTTLLNNGRWSEPENIGFPINTPDDDVFFQLTANGKHAYYSTVRNDSYGDQDIYRITFMDVVAPNNQANLTASIDAASPLLAEKFSNTESVNVCMLKGLITEAGTSLPIEVQIEVFDQNSNTKVQQVQSNSKTGRYLLNLEAGKIFKLVFSDEKHQAATVVCDLRANTSYHENIQNVQLATKP